MLEICQKKHMFLGLGILVSVTIIVLILESRLANDNDSSSRRNKKQQFVIEDNSTCWMHEKYVVIQECHPCSDTDLMNPNLRVCTKTHYNEILRCKSGETVAKSCDRVAFVDQRNFIKFSIFCFTFGLFSYLLSYIRYRILSRRIHQKLERQLNRVI